MRTNIVLDDELVKEAQVLTGVKTKKEVVHLALSELVRSRRKKDLTGLAGRVRFARDFDHKAMRELRSGSR
jgi:Arc/MetJ family transcription regulator